jgi:hypothetical protein
MGVPNREKCINRHKKGPWLERHNPLISCGA